MMSAGQITLIEILGFRTRGIDSDLPKAPAEIGWYREHRIAG
jgi:hypothetical protein